LNQCKKFNHPLTAVFHHFQQEDEESDPSGIKIDPHYLKPDPSILKPDPHNLKLDSSILEPDPHYLKSDPLILKPDPQKLKINSDGIPINSTA